MRAGEGGAAGGGAARATPPRPGRGGGAAGPAAGGGGGGVGGGPGRRGLPAGGCYGWGGRRRWRRERRPGRRSVGTGLRRQRVGKSWESPSSKFGTPVCRQARDARQGPIIWI